VFSVTRFLFVVACFFVFSFSSFAKICQVLVVALSKNQAVRLFAYHDGHGSCATDSCFLTPLYANLCSLQDIRSDGVNPVSFRDVTRRQYDA